jgi:4-diphosphocytidyl-2-C-methyl-D-erythritol kinase
MISFPNAKINLGLYVTNKRSDGFHDIETCFYPIPWKDILEIIPSEQTGFTHSGIAIPGNNESNLCLKTVAAYQERYNIPAVHIHLHKNIPIGAGLGGGSSDAAFTAKNLNTLFELNLNSTELENSVRSLGSDCAFFIQNEQIIAVEKGDVFIEKNCIDLSGYWIYLIHPSIHVSTKDAYLGVSPLTNRKPISEILKQDIATWKKELINDFELSVFKAFPQLLDIKHSLYANGAAYAAMSGSGSTLFGIFKNKPQQIAVETKNVSFLIAEL